MNGPLAVEVASQRHWLDSASFIFMMIARSRIGIDYVCFASIKFQRQFLQELKQLIEIGEAAPLTGGLRFDLAEVAEAPLTSRRPPPIRQSSKRRR